METIVNWFNVIEMGEDKRLGFNYYSSDCYDSTTNHLEELVDKFNHLNEYDVVITHYWNDMGKAPPGV